MTCVSASSEQFLIWARYAKPIRVSWSELPVSLWGLPGLFPSGNHAGANPSNRSDHRRTCSSTKSVRHQRPSCNPRTKSSSRRLTLRLGNSALSHQNGPRAKFASSYVPRLCFAGDTLCALSEPPQSAWLSLRPTNI